MRHRALALLLAVAPLLASASLAAIVNCGGAAAPAATPTAGGGTAASTSTAASSEGAPASAGSSSSAGAASSGSAAETWVEEVSGPATKSGQASKVREYFLDVTKTTQPKAGFEGATTKRYLRVIVRFPVPKVTPEGAREPHVINEILWKVRKDLAQCFYKGPGKDLIDEHVMIASLDVSKKGVVTGGALESADDLIKADAGFVDCVMANVKGLEFVPAGDDVKIRFKLKLKTIDATSVKDFTPPPEPKK
jgi:hypothetical protein